MKKEVAIAAQWAAMGIVVAAVVFAITACLPWWGMGWQRSAHLSGGAMAAMVWAAWVRRPRRMEITSIPGAAGALIFYAFVELYLG